MRKKSFYIFGILLAVLSFSACRNIYKSETYDTSDSYGSVFENKEIPKDMR